MESECTICNLPSHIFAVTRCGHNDICFLCTLKLRSLTNNIKCPLCNAISANVILTTKKSSNFTDFDEDELIAYKDGIYFDDKNTKQEVEQFNQVKCPVPGCQDVTVYASMENLKKHLMTKHNRFFCDLCLKNRTLVLKEQKLYTGNQLEKHLKKGDIDEEGNIIFFHPFCKFCYEYEYDEEALQKHLARNHLSCHLCGEDTKYIWYDKYENIERHFNISHYLCPNEECKKNCFVVFKSSAELEHHNLKTHTKDSNALKTMSSNLLLSMTGFSYGESERVKKRKEGKTEIKDKEGFDFEPQFLSKRAMKIKHYTEKEVSPNEQIDLRDYFEQFGIKDLESIIQQERYSQQPVFTQNNDYHGHGYGHGRYQSKRGKRNYYNKGNEVYVSKNQEEIYMEDTNMIKYQAILMQQYYEISVQTANLLLSTPEEFEKSMKSIISDEWKNLYYSIKDYFAQRLNEKQLFDSFVQILGQKCAYKVFPFFIATVENEMTAKELDIFYYNAISNLPKKILSPVSSIRTYGELFKLIEEELEKNILSRIDEKKLNIQGKSYIMDPARIFQLNKIVARLGNHDMAQFHFSKQFGISSEAHQLMINLMVEDKKYTQERLSSLPEEELFILYMYIEMCQDHLLNKNSYPDVNKVSKNLLAKVFAKYPNIKELFEKTLGEEEFEKLNHIGSPTKPNDNHKHDTSDVPATLKKLGNTTNTAINKGAVVQNDIEESKESKVSSTHNKTFDAQDKFEFPVLEKPQAKGLGAAKKKEGKKMLDSAWTQKNVNPFLQKAPEKELKKKIEAEFPSLGGDTQPNAKPVWEQDNAQSSIKIAPVQEEVEVWDMGFGKKDEKKLDKMVVNEKKTKKGEKILFLSGGFKQHFACIDIPSDLEE